MNSNYVDTGAAVGYLSSREMHRHIADAIFARDALCSKRVLVIVFLSVRQSVTTLYRFKLRPWLRRDKDSGFPP